jgi:hypothetical protein
MQGSSITVCTPGFPSHKKDINGAGIFILQSVDEQTSWPCYPATAEIIVEKAKAIRDIGRQPIRECAIHASLWLSSKPAFVYASPNHKIINS